MVVNVVVVMVCGEVKMAIISWLLLFNEEIVHFHCLNHTLERWHFVLFNWEPKVVTGIVLKDKWWGANRSLPKAICETKRYDLNVFRGLDVAQHVQCTCAIPQTQLIYKDSAFGYLDPYLGKKKSLQGEGRKGNYWRNQTKSCCCLLKLWHCKANAFFTLLFWNGRPYY